MIFFLYLFSFLNLREDDRTEIISISSTDEDIISISSDDSIDEDIISVSSVDDSGDDIISISSDDDSDDQGQGGYTLSDSDTIYQNEIDHDWYPQSPLVFVKVSKMYISNNLT